MASGLRAKLQAIAPGSAAPAPAAGGGLVVRVDQRAAPEGLLSLPARGLARLGAKEGFAVERCLFLDTETTGLSGGAGTVAFLVGAAYVQEKQLVTEQFILRDYSDEPEMLLRLGELLARFDTAVTFNGKTFDMPLLEARYTLSCLREHWRALDQQDLLHPARRVWKLLPAVLQACQPRGAACLACGAKTTCRQRSPGAVFPLSAKRRFFPAGRCNCPTICRTLSRLRCCWSSAIF